MNPTLRKAAVLIAALDRKNADLLLNRLSPREAQTLRQAVLRLDQVDSEEQSDVISEFFDIGPPLSVLSSTSMAGVEMDPSLAARLAAGPFDSPSLVAPATDRTPFRCLQDADIQSLVPLLRNEQPQTIAVVISRLPHHQAARVLAGLPAEIQSEVIRRVTELEEMDPETLRELERGLESWLSRHMRLPQQRNTGMAAVSDILRAAEQGAQQTLMANLRHHDQHLAQQLAAEVLMPSPTRTPVPAAPRPTFEQLAQLEDESLRTLLREAEPDLAMLALVGASQGILDRVLSLFPTHDAGVLRRELAHLGPTRLSDVEAARHALTSLAQQLATEERIDLRPARPERRRLNASTVRIR